MAKSYSSGKEGKVYIGAASTEVLVESWNLTEEMAWEETTDTGSEGFEESTPTIKKASGSFEGSWDANGKPTDDPPNLSAGQIVQIALNRVVATSIFTCSTVGIDSFNVTSAVKGIIKFTCNWHTIGTYSWT